MNHEKNKRRLKAMEQIVKCNPKKYKINCRPRYDLGGITFDLLEWGSCVATVSLYMGNSIKWKWKIR